MAPVDPKHPVELVSRRRVERTGLPPAIAKRPRNVVACPQCGFELENRCMARCRRCGYYEPCGSEPTSR